MKKFFKIIPAALAVLALASCSNDELLGEKAQQAQDVANKGDLRITMDPFDDGTRTMRDNNFGSLTFLEGDRVNVYSEDLYNTDWYEFQTDAFYYANDDEPMVSEPKFGVMPGTSVQKAYIDRASRKTRVDINIPQIITYNQESEATIDGKAMYACNLPAFGYASKNAAGYVEVKNLRYMTAILKLDLQKVVSNASWLLIVNYGQEAENIPAPEGEAPIPTFGNERTPGILSSIDPVSAKALSGTMAAVLYPDEADRKQTKLDETLDPTLTTYPYMFVDLRNVSSNTSCIYIPIVPGLDGDVDNIRLYYSADRVDPILNDTQWGDFVIANWKQIPGMQFPNITFEQHKRYTGSYAFEFADMTPKLVSAILKQYKSTASDIVIDVTNSFTIDDEENGVAGTDIVLPAFDNDVNVTINLTNDFVEWNNEDEPLELVIRDADHENPFTGTFTINAGAKGNIPAESEASMEIDLAGEDAKAIIAGNFQNTQTLNLYSGNIEIGEAFNADRSNPTANLVIEDGVVGEDVKTITIKESATIASNIDCSWANTSTITVDGQLTGIITSGQAKSEAAKCTINITGTLIGAEAEEGEGEGEGEGPVAPTRGTRADEVAEDLFAIITPGGAIWVDVNISGKGNVQGNIVLADDVKGKLSITSDFSNLVGGKVVESPEAIAVDGDVYMKGDVDVALVTEAEAISGTLTMHGSGKSLNLKQGYINGITVAVTNAGKWEDNYIDVKLNDANEGRAAFLELLELNDGVAKFTESVWDGKKIANSKYVNKLTTYTELEEEVLPSRIYTASQIASFGGIGSKCTLNNNIDLNNKAWDGYTLKTTFEGEKVIAVRTSKDSERSYPTIKNLKFEGKRGVANYGLFTKLTDATTIKNVTIDGVSATFSKIAQPKLPSGDPDPDKPEVNEYLGGIGGFVGSADGKKLTLENVAVKNVAIAAATGAAISNVGGVIGDAAELAATSVTVAGNIDGYTHLGGIAGKISNASTFAKCDATEFTFNQTYNSGKVMDLDYATVGGFVGCAAPATGTIAINITEGKAPADINFDKKAKMYTSDTTVSTGNFFNYNPLQFFIGYSGTGATKKIAPSSINDTTGGKVVWCADAGYGTTTTSHANCTGIGVTGMFLYNWPAK